MRPTATRGLRIRIEQLGQPERCAELCCGTRPALLGCVTVWGTRLVLYLTWRKNRENWAEDKRCAPPQASKINAPACVLCV